MKGMKMIKTKIVDRKKYYVVQLADDLGKYKQVGKFEDKLDAQVYRKQLVKNQEKALKSQATISVREAWKQYSDYKYSLYDVHNSLSEDMVRDYLRTNKLVQEFFPKHILLRNLTCKDLKNFFIKLKAEGQTFNNAKIITYRFKGMFEYFIGEEVVDYKDFSIKLFKVGNYAELGEHTPKKTPLYNREEYTDIYNSIKKINPKSYMDCVCYVGVAATMLTGARPAEVRGVEWSKISFQTGRLVIDQQALDNGQIIERTKAKGSNRTLVLPTFLIKILINWKQKQAKKIPNAKYVLQMPGKNRPITDEVMRDFLFQHLKKLGLAEKFKGSPFKSFRHTVSTALVNEQNRSPDLDDNRLKRQIGHRDTKLTKGLYGNHDDLEVENYHDDNVRQAIDNAVRFITK
jgi:integrase